MPRGRKPKVQATKAEVDIKILEIARIKEIEALYIDLARVKRQIDLGLTLIGFIKDAELLSEAVFKAGRAYDKLDDTNDKLEVMLNNLFDSYDLEHWDDINNN